MGFLYARGTDDPKAGMFEIRATMVAQTAKAIRINDGAELQWLPKSKIKIENNADGTIAVCMPEWLAREKGYV